MNAKKQSHGKNFYPEVDQGADFGHQVSGSGLSEVVLSLSHKGCPMQPFDSHYLHCINTKHPPSCPEDSALTCQTGSWCKRMAGSKAFVWPCGQKGSMQWTGWMDLSKQDRVVSVSGAHSKANKEHWMWTLNFEGAQSIPVLQLFLGLSHTLTVTQAASLGPKLSVRSPIVVTAGPGRIREAELHLSSPGSC